MSYKKYNYNNKISSYKIYEDPRNAIYQQYGKLVYRTLALTSKDKSFDEVQDLVHDFFTFLFEKNLLDRYDSKISALSTYLRELSFRFGLNANKYRRSQKRDNSRDTHIDDLEGTGYTPVSSQVNSHENDVQCKIDKIKILNAVQSKLKPKERLMLNNIAEDEKGNFKSIKDFSNQLNISLKQSYEIRNNVFNKVKKTMTALGY
jgi:hypothetical protein